MPEHDESDSTPPEDIKLGQYRLALAILDRQGGMMPSARFAMEKYFRGGLYPMGLIRIDEAPLEAQIPLTQESQEFTIEFESKTAFKDEITVRFSLPREVKATRDLSDIRPKMAE